MRESPGLKQLEFCRRTISSMRGCCHLPGVETAGEALYAREGEPFCGVRDATGCARTFFALVAGDCDCNWALVERDKLFVEADGTSEVDAMLLGGFLVFLPDMLVFVYVCVGMSAWYLCLLWELVSG